MPTFSLNSAFKAKENNTLKKWAIDFLTEEGNNTKLAKIINDITCVRIDLVEYPLLNLTRITGPEKDMIFHEDKIIWEQRVQSLQELINKGYELPPLIATNFWSDLHISDGCHRHEALLRNGIKKYWTIVFEK